MLLLIPLALAGDPVVVDSVSADPPVIWVHQGDRRGLYAAQPSGDDLYLMWLETTPAPVRSPLLPDCAPWARVLHLDPTVCLAPPPAASHAKGAVMVRNRRDGPTAELADYGRGTEQWVWRPVPVRGRHVEAVAELPGWTWDAVAWGVGVPLFLPTPIGAPPPMIIGHRGSPGKLPDHTLEGYALAVEQGADAIEPDLVITRDGVLIARHENNLSATTDVAARFPERKRTAVVDGETIEGFFAEDFTLAEIKTLRAVQPWPDRPHDHDGLYTIPTFDEVLDLAQRLGDKRGRPVAVIPETKHPSYFRALGLPLEPPMVASLAAHNQITSDDVVIQSFELDNLIGLRDQVGARLLLLVDGDTDPGRARLADLAPLRGVVDCLGVSRDVVWAADGPTGFVERAHDAGLEVFVWTFRAERPGPAGATVTDEVAAFLKLGVDGVFADQPDLAVAGRDRR